MAGQRWGQPRRDVARGLARGAGLVLLIAALAGAAGCGSDATGLEADRPGSGFGAGTSGNGAGSATAVVGTWRAVVVVQVPGDVQTWTTTWQFDAQGTCRETRVIESLAEGFPRTTDLACTWTSTDTAITVTFADGGGTLVMQFSFAGLSPDRLLLDGFEYQRQA